MKLSNFERDRVAELTSRMQNRRGFALVAGTGPSLDRLPREVCDKFFTIACNYSWRRFAELGESPDAILVTDRNRVQEFELQLPTVDSVLLVGDHDSIIPDVSRIPNLTKRGIIRVPQLLIPRVASNPILTQCAGYSRSVLSRVVDKANIGVGFERGFNFGYSVAHAAVQLAYAFGAQTVLLIGVDARSSAGAYSKAQPTSARFDPKFLAAPRLTLEPIFALLRAWADDHGLQLLDCSDGALTSLAKTELTNYFNK